MQLLPTPAPPNITSRIRSKSAILFYLIFYIWWWIPSPFFPFAPLCVFFISTTAIGFMLFCWDILQMFSVFSFYLTGYGTCSRRLLVTCYYYWYHRFIYMILSTKCIHQWWLVNCITMTLLRCRQVVLHLNECHLKVKIFFWMDWNSIWLDDIFKLKIGVEKRLGWMSRLVYERKLRWVNYSLCKSCYVTMCEYYISCFNSIYDSSFSLF